MTGCPKGGHNQIVKAGKIWDKQRWKCKACGFQFTRSTQEADHYGRKVWLCFYTAMVFQ